MRRALRHNSLGLAFAGLFLAAIVLQAFVGLADFNHQQVSQGLDQVSLARYVTSSDFAVDVTENWQSEYLQFFLYIFGTIWLLQRGSPESKELDRPGQERDEDQRVGRYADEESPYWAKVGGLRTAVFSVSLGLVMGGIFVLSWLVQSLAGHTAYNEQQINDLRDPVSWAEYVVSPDFWNRTLQNWQSEFLAVGSMAVLAIYLRQRGSPESKPVGAPRDATGVTG